MLAVEQIRALFAEEAEGRLNHLSQLLLDLEDTGGDEQLVSSIFRELHTLKGSSAVAGLDDVSRCAHELEELVDELRTGDRTVTRELIDTLLQGVDQLSATIPGLAGSGPAGTATPVPVVSRASVPPATVTQPGPSQPALSQPVDTRPDLEVPTVVAAPEPDDASGNDSAAPRSAAPAARSGDSDGRTVMVPKERLDQLIRLVGETSTAILRLGRAFSDRFDVDPSSLAEFNELSRSVNELQDRAMRTRMVPVSTITDRLHRTVRDLARAEGKEVRWDALGTETELDRGVLRQLSDALLHLVRNAVDHGIGTPVQRRVAGKPPRGTIRLHAMQLGSEVIIALSDDGQGIDVDAVRQQAMRRGIDTDGMTADELLQLAFRSGLSTSTFVTDISGRGVGLDVVRSSVEAVRGRVEVRSEPGEGTEFRIIVPITLAVLRCLLVESGGQRFALPFHRVVHSQAHPAGAHSSAGGRRVVLSDGRPVQLSVLADTLGMRPAVAHGPVVVLADATHRHAFQVDRLVGQQDVVLVSLNRLLPHLPAVAGASVDPDGSVLVVLDPPGLIQYARRRGGAYAVPAAQRADGPRHRILVVDDALTVRELQRSILERAGFEVRVAVDGSQALAKLAEEPSDLVLTDVEMPLMDGFALTAAIRAHPTLANIPVLILSSLASDSDRQRGLDVGADGYIVKSGFDESGLLAAVNRLIGSRT